MRATLKRMATEPRYYYHVTQKRWPNRLQLKPRDWGYHRMDEEPDDARICVSPTIEGCLIALAGCIEGDSIVSVYKTVCKVKAISPVNVIDSKITEEMWLVRPTTFERYGRIAKHHIPRGLLELSVGDSSTLQDQRNFKRKLLKNNSWLIRT